MFGVSPAFFFSLYSTDFTVLQYRSGLQLVKREGFTGYQLEVYRPDRLGEWLRDSGDLQKQGDDLGLVATQFVSHFLLPTTGSASALESDYGFRQMRDVATIVSRFPTCKVITLPCAPFDCEGKILTQKEYAAIWENLKRKLAEYCSIAASVGCSLALELVPGCLVDTTEGLLRLIDETGLGNLGLNLDTGHAWCCREPLSTIPAKLAGRIYGTHLKDNFGTVNLALPPGEGNIDWTALLDGLKANGYTGSLDLEIATSLPEETVPAYRKGLDCLKGAMGA